MLQNILTTFNTRYWNSAHGRGARCCLFCYPHSTQWGGSCRSCLLGLDRIASKLLSSPKTNKDEECQALMCWLLKVQVRPHREAQLLPQVTRWRSNSLHRRGHPAQGWAGLSWRRRCEGGNEQRQERVSDGSVPGVANRFSTLMWHGEVPISPISGRETVAGGAACMRWWWRRQREQPGRCHRHQSGSHWTETAAAAAEEGGDRLSVPRTRHFKRDVSKIAFDMQSAAF